MSNLVIKQKYEEFIFDIDIPKGLIILILKKHCTPYAMNKGKGRNDSAYVSSRSC